MNRREFLLTAVSTAMAPAAGKLAIAAPALRPFHVIWNPEDNKPVDFWIMVGAPIPPSPGRSCGCSVVYPTDIASATERAFAQGLPRDMRPWEVRCACRCNGGFEGDS